MSASSPFGQVKVYQDPVPVDPFKTTDAGHFFTKQSLDSTSCKHTPDVCADWQQLDDIAMSDNDFMSPQPRSIRVSPVLSDSHLESIGISPASSEDFSASDDSNENTPDDPKDLNHVVNMTIQSLPNHFPHTNEMYGGSRREGDPSSSPLFDRSCLPSRNAQSETSDPLLRDRLGRERLPPYGPKPVLPPGLPIPSLAERRKNANGGVTPPAIESDFSKENWPDKDMEDKLQLVREGFFTDLLSHRTRERLVQSLGPIAPPSKSQSWHELGAGSPKPPVGDTSMLSTVPSSEKENTLPLSSELVSLRDSDTSVVSSHFPANPNHIHMAPSGHSIQSSEARRVLALEHGTSSGHSIQPSEARRVLALEYGTSSDTATQPVGANPSSSYDYFPSHMVRTELNPLAIDFQPPMPRETNPPMPRETNPPMPREMHPPMPEEMHPPMSRETHPPPRSGTQNASQNGANNHGNIYQFHICMPTHSSSGNVPQNTSRNGNHTYGNGFQSPMSGQNHLSLNTTPSYNAQSEINNQTGDSRTSLLRCDPQTLNRTSQHVVQNGSNTQTNDFQVPVSGIHYLSLTQNLPYLPRNGVNSSTNGFQPLRSSINHSTLNRNLTHMPHNRGNIGSNGFQPRMPGSNQTHTPDNGPRGHMLGAVNARTNSDQPQVPGPCNPRLPYNDPRYRMPNVVNTHFNLSQPQAPGSICSSSSNNVPPNTVQNVSDTHNNTPGPQASQWGIPHRMTSRSNLINVDDTFTRALEQIISSMNNGLCGSNFRVMISPHGSNSQTSTNSRRPKPVTIIIERFIRFDEENVIGAIQAGQSQALSVLEQFKSECKTRLGIRGWKLLDSKRVTNQLPKRGWQEAFVLVQKPT